MTRRDMGWRIGGGLLLGAGCIGAQFGIGGGGAVLGYFLASIFAIVLMVNGHHVFTVLKAERRGHGLTAGVIHAGQIRRRNDKMKDWPSRSAE